jgi:L-rhamnose-H+ transport protein
MVVLLLGVVTISVAGAMRDRQLNATTASAGQPQARYAVGLLICLSGGLLCPMMNFGIFFGQPISKLVAALGTVAPYNAGYAQLLPVFLGGSLAQVAYCLFLFRRNKSWSNYFLPGTSSNWAKGILMAVVFVAGMVVYTIAATSYIGEIGPIVGWPLFLSATIIVSNVCGVATGEWKGVNRRAWSTMYAAIVLLILAIVLASLSHRFMAEV